MVTGPSKILVEFVVQRKIIGKYNWIVAINIFMY